MPIEPQKKIPKLDSLSNPKAALDLYAAFQRLYEYIDFSIRQLENVIFNQVKSGQLASGDLNNLIGILSQPLVGSNVSDPLLQSIIQSFGSQSANVVFASPSGSTGNPTFRTLTNVDIPVLSAAKITSGVFPLARLATNILKTDDGLTIDVTGAPNINSGKVIIKDNNGNTVSLMSCL